MNLRNRTPLSNTYFLGLATASAIITLGLNNPSTLADVSDQPTNLAKTVATDSIPHTERVQIKRVIYFHLLSGSQKVEQVSYAHRQVSGNTTTKWTIEPFNDVAIPRQARFKPSPAKIPVVTEVDDLSYFNQPIDIFYHPLADDEKDEYTSQQTNKVNNKDDETQTDHDDILTKDEQVGTGEVKSVDDESQSDEVPYSDAATNTTEIVTKDEAVQKDNQGIDASTIINVLEQANQETQTSIITNDQGVGDGEVTTKDTGIGDDDYLYKEQNTQTDSLKIPQADASSMTDHVDLVDTGVGDEDINTLGQIENGESKVTTGSQTEENTKETGTGDDQFTANVTDEESQTTDVTKDSKASQTDNQSLRDSETQTIKPSLVDHETSMEVANNDCGIQTDLSYESKDHETQTDPNTVEKGQQTITIAKEDVGIQTTAITKQNTSTNTDYQQVNTTTQTNGANNANQVNSGDDLVEEKAFDIKAPTADDGQSQLDRNNKQPVVEEINDDDLRKHHHKGLHERVTAANNSLASVMDKAKMQRRKHLPQTGNDTDTLTTLIGIGITFLAAGMSLFSLHKQEKSKIK
ncbi:LPXTG cell wall anchor domain-containing protein [Limosilactobacillus sp. STM2_1]|uniref:LPXTG cell wall anchor domain-containing protein n=1 Tax=Limosilactobacillus rudii TaxID=2759755 RepID=A0A7W3YMM3_9LACO|nr:LPXTG cell wall anchor domain-containing protein [Limosilactobacillus rudii]MBB1078712.1 LPXTG cell wall anchor domain-containing protein [Limosilactobacillus rudii]MBB1096720.1 LPXTG cell wall anchor domain-containing protein [Limosilactobacillus rudii]MCD7135608.1 LPXTG cell wall anchor domain-containing protein [Limosilactobacillus rudii]